MINLEDMNIPTKIRPSMNGITINRDIVDYRHKQPLELLCLYKKKTDLLAAMIAIRVLKRVFPELFKQPGKLNPIEHLGVMINWALKEQKLTPKQ
jgi:hypothetical protein